MLVQALQIGGIDFSSGMTWFVIAVAGIVVALTVSTRRGNARPRTGFTPAPAAEFTPARPLEAGGAFAAAQALFVDDPRSAVERAQAVVVRALGGRAAHGPIADALTVRYRAACAVAADPAVTVDELRAALLEFRAVLSALEDV